MNYQQELKKKLEKKAFEVSKPFCYNCYIYAKKGVCPRCHSDDLMRIMPDDGPEYGLDWIIESFVCTHCEPINIDEAFSNYLGEIYHDNIKICNCEFDPVHAYKTLDPIGFEIGRNEWLNFEVHEEGSMIEFRNQYFYTNDIENILKEQSSQNETADACPL